MLSPELHVFVTTRLENKRLVELDVLKALAIIGVILYHTGLLPSGFLGVDIFLVINGYLITKGIIKKEEQGDFYYFKWMWARLTRLWPIIAIAVVICLGLGYLIMLPDDLENLSESTIASNFFGMNILSAITVKDYWKVDNIYRPLMHLWYVGILVQCYIIYPLIFMFSYKMSKNGTRSGLLFLSILSIVSLLLCLMPNIAANEKFYYIPYRFYEIGVGGIIALVMKRKRKESNHDYGWARWLIYIALTALMIMPILNLSNAIKSLIVTILIGVGIFCLCHYRESRWIQNSSLWHRFGAIGVASYSLYIWHQILFAFYRYAVQPQLGIFDYIILLPGAALLGWLSYRFIEKPLSVVKKDRMILIPTFAVVIISTLFSGWLYMHAGVVRDVPELDIYTNNIHRGMHAEYVDRIHKYDKPFGNNGKKKVLIAGNSFARDFGNVLLEAGYRDSLDISYIYFQVTPEYTKSDEELAKEADIIFIHGNFRFDNVDKDKQYGISTKNFGSSNGYNYNRRFRNDYYSMKATMRLGIKEEYLAEINYWGKDHLVDFIEPLVDTEGKMPVFTDTHKYISQDCCHLTQNGAIYYAKILNVRKILGFDN